MTKFSYPSPLFALIGFRPPISSKKTPQKNKQRFYWILSYAGNIKGQVTAHLIQAFTKWMGKKISMEQETMKCFLNDALSVQSRSYPSVPFTVLHRKGTLDAESM